MSVWKLLNTWDLGILLLLLSCSTMYGQQDEKETQKSQKESYKMLQEAENKLGENNFASAEASYRKAVAKDPANTTAKYNMGNMYYGKEKPTAATERYKQAAEVADSKQGKHKVFHNLGNTYMDQKKYEPAIEAYKNALRNDPSDEETRYNLALAKKMLEKQKQDGGGDDDKEQDKNQKDQDRKDQKDQDKKDGDQGDKDKKDGENKDDKGDQKDDDKQQNPEKPDDKGDPKDQKENKEPGKGEQPQPPQPGQLSPQQIKSLLEAMNNEEKKVQDKINAEKTKGAKTRNEKDW